MYVHILSRGISHGMFLRFDLMTMYINKVCVVGEGRLYSMRLPLYTCMYSRVVYMFLCLEEPLLSQPIIFLRGT